jgi:IQ calmodulin-binding motif
MVQDKFSGSLEEDCYQHQPILIVTPTTNRRIMSPKACSGNGGPDTPETVMSSISHLSSERGIPPDESFGVEAEDFEVALGEIGTHWYGYMWTISLGIVGVLDILATVEPHIRNFGGCLEAPRFNTESYLCSVWLPFMYWLDKRDVGISFVFSLLWFKLAFNKAEWAKERATIKRDRDFLLNRQDARDGNNNKIRKPLDPRVAYFFEIAINMLFLPVGFYVIMYHFLRGVLFVGKGTIQEMENSVEETIVIAVTEQSYGDEGGDTKFEVFTARSKISLIHAIIHHIHLTVMAGTVIARAKLSEFLRKSAIPILLRKILGKAIRNPRKFQRNSLRALRYFRYVKYLAPIIGGLNKLKGNVDDMLKKWRQRMIAMKQRRIRRILFRRMSKPIQVQEAAIIIQSAWRAHMTRQYTHALVLLTQDKKAIAAQRIQAILRRKLAVARHRILVKKRELQRLERQNMRSKRMNSEDRRRLYELQGEFTKEANKIINRKLLMRPNTNFAVLWKLMFVICITVEISQKTLAPLVKNKMSKHSKYDNREESIRDLMAEQLIPMPTAERAACKAVTRNTLAQKLHLKKPDYYAANSTWYCHEPYSKLLDHGRDIISLALNPSPVSEWPECEDQRGNFFRRLTRKCGKNERKKSHPWFCCEPFATVHATYRWILDFFIDEFMVVVSIICFMDVFVTFFTGEIDPDTGELVPKGFVARWIIPGLLLQLLLNPAIGPVSTFVFANAKSMYFVGPVRVLRWCIAVFVPIAYMMTKMIIRGLEESDLDESMLDFYSSRIRQSSILS